MLLRALMLAMGLGSLLAYGFLGYGLWRGGDTQYWWGRCLDTAHQGLVYGRATGRDPLQLCPLDTARLEAGDLLLFHNPEGAFGYFVHAGIVGPDGRVLTQNLISGMYLTDMQNMLDYHEIRVYRAPRPAAERLAMARWVVARLDSAFTLAVHKEDHHWRSCASLAWQAWRRLGIDLAPERALLVPDDLATPQYLVQIARVPASGP